MTCSGCQRLYSIRSTLVGFRLANCIDRTATRIKMAIFKVNSRVDGEVACSLQLVGKNRTWKGSSDSRAGFQPPPEQIPKRMQILQQSQPGSLKKYETRLRWHRQQYNIGQGISPPITRSTLSPHSHHVHITSHFLTCLPLAMRYLFMFIYCFLPDIES